MKRFLIISFIVIFVFPGCGGKKTKIEVSFWHVMAGAIGDTLDQMIAEFNKRHPEAVIRSVNMGSYDALIQKLMGAVHAGAPPVLAQMYESWTDQFFRAGQLLPVQNFIKLESALGLANFYPIFVEDNTYDSTLVTLPFNKSVPVFYYNLDMFDKAGIKEFPKTWIEFKEACKKLTKDENGDGTPEVWATSWPVDVWYFSTMIYQNQGELMNVKTREVLFNRKPGIEVLEYIVSLAKEKLLYLVPGFQRQDEFLAQHIAMIPASIVSLSFIRDRVEFKMGIAPLPVWKEKATVIAGTNIGIFSKSTIEQQTTAWKFLKWLIQPLNQVRWTRASCYLPLAQSTLNYPEMQQFLSATPGYVEIINELNFARTEPKTHDWFVGRTYLNEAMEAAIRSKYLPKQALDIAAEKTKKEIDKR